MHWNTNIGTSIKATKTMSRTISLSPTLFLTIFISALRIATYRRTRVLRFSVRFWRLGRNERRWCSNWRMIKYGWFLRVRFMMLGSRNNRRFRVSWGCYFWGSNMVMICFDFMMIKNTNIDTTIKTT